ncbi:MAG: CapA family protein [Agathobacter sp.]|nr:CapA family protein [Agathobacter sp.]
MKNKRKRQIIHLSAGCSISALVFAAVFLGLGFLDPQEVNGPLKNNTQMESLLDSSFEEVTEESSIIEEPDSMQIVMVGDMLMHERVIESGKQQDGSYNFDHLFTHVTDFISAADLAIVNQETMMGGSRYGYTGYPSFNSPQELADAEVKAGFDVLLLATNHTLDKGKNAVLNCMEYLNTTHPTLGYVGINPSKEAQDNNIFTYEANGIRVAILNYTYGTNGIPLPSDMPYIVNLLEENKIRADIRKAEEIADFTIVCPHWGTEYRLEPDNSQKKWANIFLEEGVDLVLGAHPHVIEPIEWLTDENGNKMLVYYSLGNFVNGTSSSGAGVTNRMVGGIADVTLQRNMETGEVEIATYDAIPIVCHIGYKTEYTVYYMKDYTEDLASKNLILSQDKEFSKAQCEALLDQVWGE